MVARRRRPVARIAATPLPPIERRSSLGSNASWSWAAFAAGVDRSNAIVGLVVGAVALVAISLADQLANDMAFTALGTATGLGAVIAMVLTVVLIAVDAARTERSD